LIESPTVKDQMASKSALERFAIGPGARRRRGAGLWIALALLPLLASASRVWAGTEEAEQAEALIKEGVQLRAQDLTARALPLFEKAYGLSRNPRTAGQLGLCELELGFFAEAELYLSEALATPNHPWIAKNRTTLKRQLDTARANVGELALTISPATAEVLVDKKPADKVVAGVPLHLRKGPVVVEIRAPGYQPAQATIIIVGGKREERTFALVPDSPPPVVPVAETSPSVTLATDAPPAQTSETDPRRIAAWATGSGALLALAVGTIEAFNAASKRDDFNNHTSLVGGMALPDCTTVSLSAQCKPLKDDYDHALTLSVVGFVTAGALAAASSVLFVLSSSGHVSNAERAGGTPVAPALACVPDLGVRGLGCSLRF
jgi:tetratricopeptide (TPR) repeat protein